MKKKNTLLLLLFILLGNSLAVYGQNVFTTVVSPLKNERWWGGVVALGHQMPFGQQLALQDLARNNRNNQLVPCMISSAGRYIWAENPFRFEMKNACRQPRSDPPAERLLRSFHGLQGQSLQRNELSRC